MLRGPLHPRDLRPVSSNDGLTSAPSWTKPELTEGKARNRAAVTGYQVECSSDGVLTWAVAGVDTRRAEARGM